MKKPNGFEKLSLMLVTGLVVSACGPVAPSVSKLSNSAAQKTNTTDGSSPANDISSLTEATLASQPNDASANQHTHTLPFSQFRREWSGIEQAKLSLSISDSKLLNDLIDNGVIRFPSSQAISGREEHLAAGKLRILVGINADSAGVVRLGLKSLRLKLRWKPTGTAQEPAPHWELSFVPSQPGDPVKDVNDERRLKNALDRHLLQIGIEFLAE